MNYRKLGSTGLRVSGMGLGCNNFGMRCDEARSIEVVHAALDHGINFFDTADVYDGSQSELLPGRVISEHDRSQIVIATKFGNRMGEGVLHSGASRHHIMNAVEASPR
jgi:aryl-alcohol dehydrogenase-like predicted oxidoreductase|tara:strand:- start:750 stop:1073 length:324 start_codon:yes stop_codon:yes gene_type:complete